MAVTFNGISSGIDTQAIIKAMLDAQRKPITQLESKRSGYNSQISALGKITSKLDELSTLAKDMADTSKVLAFTIGVGDEEVMTAEANGETTAATYDIDVTQLARAEKNRSAAFGTSLSNVRAGVISLKTAGDDATYDVAIEDGDTLEDVVDKINGSGAKVDASIVRDGTRTYVQVVASEFGHEIGGNADDAVTITETYSGASGQELGLTQVVQAQNAKMTIDGLAAESRTNQPNDLVAGVKLQLKKTGTSSVKVETDGTGTKKNLDAFIAKANELLTEIKNQTRTADGGRTVEPDPAVERLGNELRALVSKAIDGVPSASSSLARIGIETDSSGMLKADTKKLDKAIAGDIRSIARLFTKADTGLSATIQALAKRYTDTTGGVIAERKKLLNGRVDSIDKQVDRMETRLDGLQVTLQKQFTAMEKALQTYTTQGSALSSLYYG